MARRFVADGIILRTVDVGEADRFCIMLTRECGRLAARARGVRKPGSRMGGALLPFRRVQVEMAEHSAGLLITGATLRVHDQTSLSFAAFTWLTQAADLLLALTQDDEPLPELFAALDDCIARSHLLDASFLPFFQVRTLSLLGLLPATSEDERFSRLSVTAKEVVHVSAHTTQIDTLRLSPELHGELVHFLQSILCDHLDRPLRSADAGSWMYGLQSESLASEAGALVSAPLPAGSVSTPTW